jgi:hypothetical protein
MGVLLGVLAVALAIYLVYIYMAELTVVLLYLLGIILLGFLLVNFHMVGMFFRRYIKPLFTDRPDDQLSSDKLKVMRTELVNKITEAEAFSLSGKDIQKEEIRSLTEKLALVTEQIDTMDMVEDKMQDYEANSIIRRQSLDVKVESKLNERTRENYRVESDFENEMKQKELEYEDLNTKVALEKERLDHERELRKQAIDNNEEDLERKRADIYAIKNESDVELLIAQADCNLKDARKIKEIDEADFIRNVLTKIDPSKLPPEMQAYLVACVFNKNTNSYDDYIMHEKLKRHVELKAKAEADKVKAEAEKIRSDANYRTSETKNIKNKNQYDSWKQSESQKRWN